MSNKKNKKRTIGKITQTRGVMPPPQRADIIKNKVNDRRKVRQKLKRGDYDV